MAKELYNVDYSHPSGTIKLYKYDVPLPVMPPLETMINFGLSIEEQKFRRTVIPKSILSRKQKLTPEEDKFINEEWHKRKNGVWIIIKGLPIYFTGPYYTYLNYWWTKNGSQPDFRYIQCLIFLFWDMVVRDKNCYGAKLVKPRRIGGTEFTLFLMWEYITRVRDVKAGMQSKNEATVEINFKRLTRGNMRVIWFMKPIQKGAEDPDGKLEYRYPRKVTTDKSLREQAQSGEEIESIYSESEMNSEIDFRACDPFAYDNEELNRYILNESGKLERMSLINCWDKVKPCLHYFDGAEIVGKAWMESTIEEINDEQIEEINSLCDDSMPEVEKRDANGRTISGLYLLFINYLDAAEPDEWGFSKTDQAKQFHENKIAALRKKKNFQAITSLLRKEPETLEDALTPSGAQSSFNIDRLQDAIKRLNFPETYGFKEKEWTVKGNFIWAGGVPDTKVVFLPDEGGKFEVSQLLKDGQDNNVIEIGGIKYPGNLNKFRGGCDPYEHSEVVDKARASKGGAVMMKLYDDNEDGAKIDDGSPIDWGWEWTSKQPVCDYLEREEDPDVFFEDMLMMHVYYGTQMNVENNKQSIKKHFKQRGYGEFLMARPESTMEENSRSNLVNQIGTPATTDTIDQYFMAIAHYVMVYGNAIKHRRILLQLLEMNKKNRGKQDLGVGFGWSLIACEKKYFKIPETETQGDGTDWFAYTVLN